MQNNKRNDSESLKKSHSKSSNAKLTLLCFLTILAFSILWVSIALIGSNFLSQSFSIVLCAVSGILTLLGLIGFNLFKR